jgi:hypothetical protein
MTYTQDLFCSSWSRYGDLSYTCRKSSHPDFCERGDGERGRLHALKMGEEERESIKLPDVEAIFDGFCTA